MISLLFYLVSAAAIYSAVGALTPQYPIYPAAGVIIPQYGVSAGGKTAPARGWNSFVIQSNTDTQHELLWTSEVQGYAEQCSQFATNGRIKRGFDYYCSMDSGWSVGDHGDDNGRIIPNQTVFATMSISRFAENLHATGMKLGIYVVPGAFVNDGDKLVKGTKIQIKSLFNTTVTGIDGVSNSYLARNDFDYTKDGVQQWHDSQVELFKSWY